MIKQRVTYLLFTIFFTAFAQANEQKWGYGFFAASDEVFNSEIRFILSDNVEIRPLYIGVSGAFLTDEILNNYFAFRGFSGTKLQPPYPIKAYVEWVSLVDKKRYGIWLDLPSNLQSMMASDSYVSQCGKSWQIRRILNFGVAPGGYIETYVGTGCGADRILLRRDFAKEVQTAYDKQIPLYEQYKNRLRAFDERNKAFFDKHTIPYWRFQLDQPPIATSQ